MRALHSPVESGILKVFKPWVGIDLINNEKNAAEATFLSGIPTPRVFGLQEIEGNTAIIYERITNRTMEQCLADDIFNAKKYGRQMAELHLSIHAISPVQPMPKVVEAYTSFVLGKKSLSAEDKQKVVSILAALSGDDKLCHGDFHPQNILYHNEKPYIIDWTGAAVGNPMVDVCGTYLVIKIAQLQKNAGKVKAFVSNLVTNSFLREYLKVYFQNSKHTLSDMKKWLPVKAAMYMDVGFPKEIEKIFIDLIAGKTANV